MRKGIRIVVSGMVIASVVAAGAGCYGPFTLTRTIHR